MHPKFAAGDTKTPVRKWNIPSSGPPRPAAGGASPPAAVGAGAASAVKASGAPPSSAGLRKPAETKARPKVVQDEKSLETQMLNMQARTADRKQAKRIGRNKDTINELVRSLNDNPKFTKMVEYSVGCLANLAVDEVSVEEMINEGVLDTLLKIQKLNPYNEKIQRVINKTLEAFAINERLAAMIAKKIGGGGLVLSLKKHVEPETLESTAKAMSTLTKFENKEIIGEFVRAGAIGGIAHVLGQNVRDVGVLGSSLESLSHIVSASPENAKLAFQEPHLVDNVLNALSQHPENAKVVENAIGVIATLAKTSPEILAALKKMGAVDIVVAALELHPDNEKILETGAIALTHLAGADDLGAAMSVSVGNNLATARAISKLSSLMLVPENVDYMARNQGVGWLVAALKGAVGQEGEIPHNILLAGTRALARMATDENKIYGIMQQGGVKLLISIMTAHAGDDEVAVSSLQALSKMLTRKENGQFIMKSAGVEAALALLQSHPKNDKVAKAVVEFLQRLAAHPENVPGLVEKGAIKALVDTLVRHGDGNADLALLCVNTLGRTAISAENMQKIAEAGGLEALVNTLVKHPDNLELAKQTMLMMESAAMIPANIEILRKAGAVDAILGAIEANPEDAELQEIAARTLATVAGKDQLKAAVSSVGNLSHQIASNPMLAKANLVKLGAAVRMLGNLALVDGNVEYLVQNGAVDALCAAFNSAVALPPSAERSKVLKDAAAGLLRLATSSPEAARTLVKTNALKNMIKAALADPENEEMAEYACIATAICASDPANVDKMIADGTIEDIIALAKAHPLNEKVLAAATKALGLMAKDEAAIKRIIAAGGAEVVVESLFANMDNPEALLNALQVISQLSADEAAIQALVDAGAIDAILEAMRKHPQDPEILKACMSALCSLMVNEDIANQVGEKGGIPLMIKSMRDHFRDEPLCEVDMVLCDSLASVPANAEKFLADDLGTIDLVKWVAGKYAENKTIEDAAAKLLATLTGPPKKEESKDPTPIKLEQVTLDEAKTKAMLADLGAGDSKAKQNMLAQLTHILQDPNNAKMMVQKGGLQALAAMMRENKDDEGVFYNASSAFLTLLENGGEAANALMEDPACMEALALMMSASERFATPMSLADLTRAVAAVAKMKLKPANVKEMMKSNPLNALMKIMVQSDDPMLLTQAAKLLGKLSNNEEALNQLAQLANIRELINAMRRNFKNEEFLQFGVYLLGNLGNNEELKSLIGIEGGIQLIIQIMQTYPNNQGLIENCCYSLAILTFGNAVNCSFVVACKGIQALLNCMSIHQKAEELLESSVSVICNLCAGNDPNKEEIVKLNGAQAIVDTVLNNFDALDLLTTCFRALGNLAYNKKCISVIIKAGGVQGIVAGMTVHSEELAIIDVAIRVLTNLAADPDDDNMAIMAQEGAVQAVVEVAAQYTKNVELETAALGCLCNLARARYNAEMIVRQGGTEASVEAMKSSGFHPILVDKAVRLILALSLVEKEKDRMLDAGVVGGLCAAMKAHSKARPVLGASMSSLSNLAYGSATAARVGSDEAGPIQLVSVLLKTNVKDPVIVEECFKALGAISKSPEHALMMADQTMELAAQTFALHISNAVLIAACLRFLANLFYHKACSDKIVVSSVVGNVLGVLNHHSQEAGVLVRGCKALENMAYGSDGTKEFLKREGVIQAMKKIITDNPTKDDVKRAASATIDALEKVEIDLGMQFTDLRPRIDKKKDAKDIFGGEEKKQVKVLSREIRNMLNAGALMTKHSKTAAPRPRHVYIDNDLKYLIWKDPKDKTLDPKNMMKVYMIRSVERGRCTPQLQRKALLGKHFAKEECAFSIQGRERTVDLEAESEAMREKWIHAIETLVEYKKGLKALNTKIDNF